MYVNADIKKLTMVQQDVWPKIIGYITNPKNLEALLVADPVFRDPIGSRSITELVSISMLGSLNFNVTRCKTNVNNWSF